MLLYYIKYINYILKKSIGSMYYIKRYNTYGVIIHFFHTCYIIYSFWNYASSSKSCNYFFFLAWTRRRFQKYLQNIKESQIRIAHFVEFETSFVIVQKNALVLACIQWTGTVKISRATKCALCECRAFKRTRNTSQIRIGTANRTRA